MVIRTMYIEDNGFDDRLNGHPLTYSGVKVMKRVIRYLLDSTFCPPRAAYDPKNTISAIISGDDVYERIGVTFESDSSLSITGSLWRDHSNSAPTACTIFLHSLGANQFEGLNIIPFLCTRDLAFFAFDFPGCGVSEGKATPLDGSGYHIVLAAAKYLRTRFAITKVALWGRSLGAAIALHAVSASNEFCCVVSDSSFSSTHDVISDQGSRNKIPKFLVSLAHPIFTSQAKRILEMDVNDPFPINIVQYAQTPLLMGHGSLDTFVPVEQSRKIFAKYGHKNKQLYIFEAKHNTPRPWDWYHIAARFMYRETGIEAKVKNYNEIFRDAELHVGSGELVLQDIARSVAFKERQKVINRQEAETAAAAVEVADRELSAREQALLVDGTASREEPLPKGGFLTGSAAIP
jgi:alpha-beta hydrolase superfamily lysophospholipase